MILQETKEFKVSTVYDEKKILVELPNGEMARIKHKRLLIIFEHQPSKDRIEFRITGKGNYYRKAHLETREEQISEHEIIEEFDRLVGDGKTLFKRCECRLILEVFI